MTDTFLIYLINMLLDPCYENDFTCADGSCIPDKLLCDGTADCQGHHDEMNCCKFNQML